MNGKRLSRRQVLVGISMLSGGLGAGFVQPASASAAPGQTGLAARRWAGRTTQNGWPVIGGAQVTSRVVEGSDVRMALRSGDVETVLLHVVRRFHYEIDTLKSGDIHGYTTDRTLVAPFESNYLSGTAIAIRARAYPTGSAGNLFPLELLVVRDILAECDGVVRWGGDDKDFPKEGHIQIDLPPSADQLKRVAAKIRSWQARPDRGAGTAVDPLAATRRAAAVAMERRQRAA